MRHRSAPAWAVAAIGLGLTMMIICGTAMLTIGIINGQLTRDYTSTTQTKAEGVRIARCDTVGMIDKKLPNVKVLMRVVNNTDKVQTYTIDLLVHDESGNVVGRVSATVQGIKPSIAVDAMERVILSKHFKRGTRLTCSINRVQ